MEEWTEEGEEEVVVVMVKSVEAGAKVRPPCFQW